MQLHQLRVAQHPAPDGQLLHLCAQLLSAPARQPQPVAAGVATGAGSKAAESQHLCTILEQPGIRSSADAREDLEPAADEGAPQLHYPDGGGGVSVQGSKLQVIASLGPCHADAVLAARLAEVEDALALGALLRHLHHRHHGDARVCTAEAPADGRARKAEVGAGEGDVGLACRGLVELGGSGACGRNRIVGAAGAAAVAPLGDCGAGGQACCLQAGGIKAEVRGDVQKDGACARGWGPGLQLLQAAAAACWRGGCARLRKGCWWWFSCWVAVIAAAAAAPLLGPAGCLTPLVLVLALPGRPPGRAAACGTAGCERRAASACALSHRSTNTVTLEQVAACRAPSQARPEAAVVFDPVC